MNLATTPSGEEMVVLTRAEYDALLASAEDAADIALARAAAAESAGAPVMPAELALAAANGEIHPLAAWRKAVGLSQAELAERAGVRAATISDIENGRLDPRLSTLRALAEALGLEIDDIVE